MNEEKFWAIIKKGNDSENLHETVETELRKLSPEQIQMYHFLYQRYCTIAFNDDIWRAAFVIFGGFCSDDGFTYFCRGLVSMGEEVYFNAIEDPDSLAEVDDLVDGDEEFGYIADTVYEEKTGDDFIDTNPLAEKYGVSPFYGAGLSVVDADDFHKRLPKLIKRFGWHVDD